jgi:putative flavoprotein involved in K+ transport
MAGKIDCVVVGAGPAGLAASVALAQRGIDHVVLEAGQVGQSWRTQRWNSFRLNTPGWMNQLLGEQSRHDYLSGAEVVQRLEKLAAQSPIRAGVRVTNLTPRAGGHVLRTSDGELRVRTVVVATGAENIPRLPTTARAFPARLAQFHAANYRHPAQLPDGGVLVVGSGQSGVQIAEDLVARGRHVVLSTSAVGRMPTPYRGRDILEWIAAAGFYDQRPEVLPDRSTMYLTNSLIGPGGRAMSLQALAHQGVILAGGLKAVEGERVDFTDTVAANIAAADQFADQARAAVDDLIQRDHLSAPPARPEQWAAGFDLHPPQSWELWQHQIQSIVWCTGFAGDFRWLDDRLLDDDGQPLRMAAGGAAPGLWYVGLRWLLRRASNILYGFPGDAAVVADAIKRHLGSPGHP